MIVCVGGRGGGYHRDWNHKHGSAKGLFQHARMAGECAVPPSMPVSVSSRPHHIFHPSITGVSVTRYFLPKPRPFPRPLRVYDSLRVPCSSVTTLSLTVVCLRPQPPNNAQQEQQPLPPPNPSQPLPGSGTRALSMPLMLPSAATQTPWSTLSLLATRLDSLPAGCPCPLHCRHGCSLPCR